MRVHEVELYTSKQIYAFIEYLKVLAEEKAHWEKIQNSNTIGNANIGSQFAAGALVRANTTVSG